MAHLNLVMIHPFRDGNGRMARALATLVLTRSDIGEPEFSSIEEWLGANTEDYYGVLAHTGHGSWQPRADAHLWLTFNLRAHHMQAQTVARRVDEAGPTWGELDALAADTACPSALWTRCSTLPSATGSAAAAISNVAEVTEQTATRDLAALASAGHPERARHRPGPLLHRRRAAPADPGAPTRGAQTTPRPVPVDARKTRRAGLIGKRRRPRYPS